MKFISKAFVLSVSFLILLAIDYAPEAPFRIRLVDTAEAIIGLAPGGSVIRRRAIVGTAAVVATTSASAAAASAPPPPPPPPAAGPAPVGTVTTTLPPGCKSETLNDVEYQLCGAVYYKPTMQGTNLVYVVSQP